MNNFFVSIILSLSILIPAMVGLFRYRLIDKIFFPFLLLLWIGTFNEILSLACSYAIKTNSVNSNIYILVEYVLILLQFYKWNYASLWLYIFMVAAGVLGWMADNLLLNSVFSRNASFRIFYSFVIIFFSISQVNKLIVYERRGLLKNPVFLTCLSFLVYYSCKAFVEVFVVVDLGLHDGFSENVFMIMIFANFISNILYTIALVCIPPKLEFTLPY